MTSSLPKVTLEHGLPTFLPEVVEWRKNLPKGVPGRGRLPRMVYTDGSAMHPRDIHLRVAGWSIVWRDENGDWTGTGGRCRGQQSAARAEIEALIQVCLLATAPCVITSDCKGAVLGFRAVQNAQSLPKHLAKGPCADLWQALREALEGAPRIAVRWMPAHCTKEELCARGGTEEDWTGNDEADKLAKQEARKFAPPDWLVQARARQLDKEGAAMRIISEIQCRVLSTRPRLRLAVTAMKARKRRAPALPAALRRSKKARAGPAPAEEPQALGSVADFATHRARMQLPAAVPAGLALGAGGWLVYTSPSPRD